MAASPETLETLREQVTAAIQHGTDLIADLKTLAAGFESLVPEIAGMTEAERVAFFARLVGFEEGMPERLAALVESLADVLAGLTSSDGGEAWAEQQLTRLGSGEGAEEAA
jgi:hypothetical protein